MQGQSEPFLTLTVIMMYFSLKSSWSGWSSLLVRVLVSLTQCAQFGADSVRICIGLMLLGLPQHHKCSAVSPVVFIDTCVVVCSERTHGPAPLLAREMLWKCPWHFHELVGDTLTAFCGHVLHHVRDRTAWPNSWEMEQEEEEAGQLTHLQKDKTFVVLKIRSHSADPTFPSNGTISRCWMGGAVVAAQLGELWWPKVCWGSVERAVDGDSSEVGSPGGEWGLSPQGMLWGCLQHGNHPIFEGLRCCFTREMWRGQVWCSHHPHLWTVNLTQRCAVCKGCCPALKYFFFSKQLLVGLKGLWGNKTPPAQHFVPWLHLQQSFHFSTPYDFGFNSCAFLCQTNKCGNILPCAA